MPSPVPAVRPDKTDPASQPLRNDPPRPRSWWEVVKQALSQWSDHRCSSMGAALAYYTVFSIAPLLVITVAVGGFILRATEQEGSDQTAVQARVHEQLAQLLGEQAGESVMAVATNASQKPQAGVIATLLGVAALLFGASGVFAQLQDSLNIIWEVAPKPNRVLKEIVKTRVMSFTMVAVIAFLLLVSLVVSAVLHSAIELLDSRLPLPAATALVIEMCFSFVVITLLFALIFKYLPDVAIRWRDVWLGAAITSLLFTAGKYVIGLYLGRAGIASSYGAAGSLVVVLLWAYYSSLILFLGAEFTRAHARFRGSPLLPARDAMRLTRE